MKLNKLLGSLTIAFVGFVGQVHAQIPVTDAAAIAKSAADNAEQLLKWVEQIRQMEQQYKQMEREFQSITGARGMGDLLNNSSRLITGESFEKNYRDLLSMGESGASPEAKEIYAAIKELGCSNYESQSQKATCEAQAYAAPEMAAYVEGSLKAARERANDLQQLVAQVDSTTDMKGAADLANRISAEQAILQNEQTMVNLALSQRQSQSELIALKKFEEGKKAIKTNTLNPFSFD